MTRLGETAVSTGVQFAGFALVGYLIYRSASAKIENALPSAMKSIIDKYGWVAALVAFGIAAVAVLTGTGMLAALVAFGAVVSGGALVGRKLANGSGPSLSDKKTACEQSGRIWAPGKNVNLCIG